MSVSIFGPTGNCRKLHSKNKLFEEDFCCHCDRLKNSSERQIKRTYGTAGKVPCKRASGSASPPPPPSPSLTTQRANNRYDDQNRGSLSEASLAKRVNSCDPLGFVAGPAGGARMFKDTAVRKRTKSAAAARVSKAGKKTKTNDEGDDSSASSSRDSWPDSDYEGVAVASDDGGDSSPAPQKSIRCETTERVMINAEAMTQEEVLAALSEVSDSVDVIICRV